MATRSTRSRPASGGDGTRRARGGAKTAARDDGSRWLRNVTGLATHAPRGLFSQDAETIARVMATPRVSPNGIGSAIRMIQFFLNRAGRTLSAARRRELERAKRILQAKQRD